MGAASHLGINLGEYDARYPHVHPALRDDARRSSGDDSARRPIAGRCRSRHRHRRAVGEGAPRSAARADRRHRQRRCDAGDCASPAWRPADDGPRKLRGRAKATDRRVWAFARSKRRRRPSRCIMFEREREKRRCTVASTRGSGAAAYSSALIAIQRRILAFARTGARHGSRICPNRTAANRRWVISEPGPGTMCTSRSKKSWRCYAPRDSGPTCPGESNRSPSSWGSSDRRVARGRIWRAFPKKHNHGGHGVTEEHGKSARPRITVAEDPGATVARFVRPPFLRVHRG